MNAAIAAPLHGTADRTRVTTIYKICPESLWRAAERAGVFHGSADDRRDGFIHFSTAGQLAGTLHKHFRDQRDLLLIAVDAEAFGDALKWEISRGGEAFPHLYGEFPMSAASSVMPIPSRPDGSPDLEGLTS